MNNKKIINDLIIDIIYKWKETNKKEVGIRSRREALSYIICRTIYIRYKYNEDIQEGLRLQLSKLIYELVNYQVNRTRENKRTIDKIVEFIDDYYEEN